MAVRNLEAVQQLSGSAVRAESRPGRIGPISLGAKQTGERRAGNPHAAFDVAGTGNVAWSRCCDTRRRKGETTGNTNIDLNRRASPRPYLGAPGGEIPPGDSTNASLPASASHWPTAATSLKPDVPLRSGSRCDGPEAAAPVCDPAGQPVTLKRPWTSTSAPLRAPGYRPTMPPPREQKQGSVRPPGSACDSSV